MVRTFLVALCLAMTTLVAAAPASALDDTEVGALAYTVMFGKLAERPEALQQLVDRDNRDIIPSLVLAARYIPGDPSILIAVSLLADKVVRDWKEAMLWVEAHPEVEPHESYRGFKLDLLKRLDPAFERFLGADRAKAENMKIRLEEIVWGGVPVDGIPSLDNPKLVGAGEASYLLDEDLVFGAAINGDVRAYPLRIMGWHEMFNETIGGVPVALAYCTLCGAGILFETQVEGRDRPLVFGSSGLLYRSNKLMFDRETDSLWNQFTGQPVSGPLVNSGIELKIRPVTITSWAEWKALHPDTRVLSIDTGHQRDYGSGVVYQDYFASPDLMFPTIVGNEEAVRRKDYVFGIRDVGAARAWPVEAFNGRPVLNDAIGPRNLVLIGDALTRTVRAYERGDRTFAASDTAHRISGPGGDWTVTEEALVGPDGVKLARVPGHVSYWFAWDGYMGVESTLYRPEQ
jgi:hypothetical protein